MIEGEKDMVVRDTLKITRAIKRHLSETSCKHTIKEIAEEAFD